MITITDKENCCGCSACANTCPVSCIAMNPDEEGFIYPVVDKAACLTCGLCSQVCPILQNRPEKEVKQTAFLVQNRDAKVLRESTSGGAFTAIAQTVLARGGVVFGAAFDENMQVQHRYIEREKDLALFRNSKYVQSEIGQTFRQAKAFLESGRQVCFSGTPCQIEGLKCFFQRDYGHLVTVDVVCRAVPSPLIWEKYKQFRAGDKTLTQVSFRDKEPYGYEYSQISLTAENKKEHYGVEEDAYLRAFFSNLSDRPCCYYCKFKKRYRISDITIWDCFDVYKLDKGFDDNRGVSRALVHTLKGKAVISQIGDLCAVKEIPVEDAIKGVKEMFYSVSLNKNRESFFTDALRLEADKLFLKYFSRTTKVTVEHLFRISCEALGIYRPVKRLVKKRIG